MKRPSTMTFHAKVTNIWRQEKISAVGRRTSAGGMKTHVTTATGGTHPA